MHFITKSSEDTKKLGIKFAKLLKKGDCVLLTGDLGSGKTTFTQGMGRGLGIKGNMPSPTFVLVREYPEKSFIHADLYRIGEKDFLDAGLNQYLNAENICAIEWAEKFEDLWPSSYIKIEFETTGEDIRKINFKTRNRVLKIR